MLNSKWQDHCNWNQSLNLWVPVTSREDNACGTSGANVQKSYVNAFCQHILHSQLLTKNMFFDIKHKTSNVWSIQRQTFESVYTIYSWLELKRGINCICRGMYKLSHLENYELSLGWKMKLWVRLSALQDLWILVDLQGSTSRCAGTLDLWIQGSTSRFCIFCSFLGVFSTMYSDMYLDCTYDTQG